MDPDRLPGRDVLRLAAWSMDVVSLTVLLAWLLGPVATTALLAALLFALGVALETRRTLGAVIVLAFLVSVAYANPEAVSALISKCTAKDATACRQLGDLYASGEGLVGHCAPKAAQYFRAACKAGDKSSCPKPLHAQYRKLLKSIERRMWDPDRNEQTIAGTGQRATERQLAAEDEHLREAYALAELVDREITHPGSTDPALCVDKPGAHQMVNTRQALDDMIGRPASPAPGVTVTH
jgi:TPR repeat protein